MTKKILSLAVITALSLGFSGCGASKFSEIKKEDIKAQIIKGKTTIKDVEVMLGEPNSIEMTTLKDAMSKLGISNDQMGGILGTMLNYQRNTTNAQNTDKSSDIVDPKLANQEVDLWTYSELNTNSHTSAASYIPIIGGLVGSVKNETKTKTLKMIFNSDGILMDYRYLNSTQESSHGFGLI